MAKISRNQLKALVKECLVEVLVEGLSSENSSSSLIEATTRKKAIPKKKPSARVRPSLDNINFDKKINQRVSACTTDPVLGNILADTAKTTLQEQLGEERNNVSHDVQVAANGDPAAKAISSADPSDLFGESAGNWAALAFSDSKQTK